MNTFVVSIRLRLGVRYTSASTTCTICESVWVSVSLWVSVSQWVSVSLWVVCIKHTLHLFFVYKFVGLLWTNTDPVVSFLARYSFKWCNFFLLEWVFVVGEYWISYQNSNHPEPGFSTLFAANSLCNESCTCSTNLWVRGCLDLPFIIFTSPLLGQSFKSL